MTNEDFFNLHIGQKIFHNERERTIECLYISKEINRIGFQDQKTRDVYLYWDEICADCSLEPPKKIQGKYFYNVYTFGHTDSLTNFMNTISEDWDIFQVDIDNRKVFVRKLK